MPFYHFEDTRTGEVVQELLSISALDQYKEDNPHMKQLLNSPDFIGGQSVSGGKLPGGFKERLSIMKDKHPRSKGLDHLL